MIVSPLECGTAEGPLTTFHVAVPAPSMTCRYSLPILIWKFGAVGNPLKSSTVMLVSAAPIAVVSVVTDEAIKSGRAMESSITCRKLVKVPMR